MNGTSNDYNDPSLNPTTIIIWNLKSNDIMHVIATPYSVKYIDLSPDSTSVIALLDDDDMHCNTLIMYDISSSPRLVYKTIISMQHR